VIVEFSPAARVWHLAELTFAKHGVAANRVSFAHQTGADGTGSNSYGIWDSTRAASPPANLAIRNAASEYVSRCVIEQLFWEMTMFESGKFPMSLSLMKRYRILLSFPVFPR
jgi:hypothetical protein